MRIAHTIGSRDKTLTATRGKRCSVSAARYMPKQKRAGSDEGVRSRFRTSATRQAQFVSPCSKKRAGLVHRDRRGHPGAGG